ncbi:HD domain-containing protein [Cytobacillus sp. S13-E01]|uniref:HD domain-containing protein n=1 Tax=Cytobacillus sp. S13-E01 TaxID=3031326 RepID=UPI0023D813A8|nr:HD domain-containing protein [Cytobacillus sp. S13-E01]MDF0725390.1 HD domain-containing protein [Cytobacillus sp. S13-E01]
MSLVDKARDFAMNAHKEQKRKLTSEPYFVHLEGVAQTLRDAGFSEEVVAAGYLHDVVEDTSTTIEEIEKIFGKKIAVLVMSNTETKALSWEIRKQHTIDSIEGASLEIKALIAADKLDNINSLLEACRIDGDGIWESFNRGYAKQSWYYKALVKAILAGIDESDLPAFFHELREKSIELFS